MNLRCIGLSVGAGTLVTGGVVIAVVSLNNSKSDINYAGKTLKSKYPLLQVPKPRPKGDYVYYNNGFWLGKTKKLHR